MDFKRAVLTAGLMGAAACGPPDGTRELTEDELDFVAEKIDKEQENLDAAASLLGGTNTFFGLEGEKIKNNGALLDTLDGQGKNLHARLADGGILAGNEEFFQKNGSSSEGAQGLAYGCRSKRISAGDYLVLPEVPMWTTFLENGEEIETSLDPIPGALLHEEGHYVYGAHDKNPNTKNVKTITKYLMMEKDAPFLASELSDLGGDVLISESIAVTGAGISEDQYENIRADIEAGRTTPQDIYDWLLLHLADSASHVETVLWNTYDSGQLFLLTNHGLTEEDYANYVEERRETLIEEREEAIHATMERLLKDYPGQIELGEN